MEKWEKFEVDCTKYLCNKFSKYATFIHKGGADSTIPDIFVESNDHQKSFYIEAKHTPAQCGQFVLMPDMQTRSFTFSHLNSSESNQYSDEIVQHMNASFDEFLNAGTAGKEIILNNGQETFCSWIAETYHNKGVKYFITNDYVLLPIEKFNDFFTATATYRIKRSGSSSAGSKRFTDIINYLASKNCYGNISFMKQDEKLFVKSNKALHDIRFNIGNYEFMFSKRDYNYEIRKLSNTYNANVIFSISIKPNVVGISDNDFISSFLV